MRVPQPHSRTITLTHQNLTHLTMAIGFTFLHANLKEGQRTTLHVGMVVRALVHILEKRDASIDLPTRAKSGKQRNQ